MLFYTLFLSTQTAHIWWLDGRCRVGRAGLSQEDEVGCAVPWNGERRD